MVGILLISAVVSITFAIISHEYADLIEGFVILIIVVINALIGVFQERKAQQCLDLLKKYDNSKCVVLRNNQKISIDSTELVVGDIVFLNAGNIVPADVRLVETNNFACDESMLTGESDSVEKHTNIINKKNCPLAERKNMAYMGTSVVRGKATGVVVAIGKSTEMGKISDMIFNSKKEVTPLQKSINKIGKIITWTVVFISLAILIIEIISGNNIVDAVMLSVALAVAAIPESLPAVITIILALGVQQLAKRKCIIRHLHAVETLGSCEVICTDKTGTLTQNKMQVVDSFCFSSNSMSEFYRCIRICNNSHKENNRVVGESTEVALYEFVENKINVNIPKIIHEIPFDSSRKMMTVVTNENGLHSYTKGAPERLLNQCKYYLKDGKIELLNENIKDEISKQNNLMTDNALRVIGFAYKTLDKYNPQEDLENDLVFLGLCGMKDNIRTEVKSSIENCFKAGLMPIMITGDHKRTAFAIAKELKIATKLEQVITGEELDMLSDKELRKLCKSYKVYARVSPEHKVRIVKAFKSINKIVAMTGDGVNDAPSLKISDIGVGMGKSGTDVVKNVADMLITDDNFSTIVVAVEEGRKIYSNIQKTLQFLISTNCVEVFGMLIALLFFPEYTFLTASQMLYINLVTDSLPAFALGMEKVEDSVMKSPPRNSRAGLFSGQVGIGIIYQSIVQTLIVMAVFVVGIKFYNPEVASTMAFFTIIFMQLLHSVNCKSNSSIIKKDIFNNKTFNICFLITLLLNLLVAVLPVMYTIFGLVRLNASQWVVVIIASIIIIPMCELLKAILSKDEDRVNKKNKIKQKIKLSNSASE
ncbi:MAG: cation-translocating P-type ATPase [Clostridia bacterium]|nr:cation-translocating P-type ATPase [Clostridia bacterium]